MDLKIHIVYTNLNRDINGKLKKELRKFRETDINQCNDTIYI